MQIKDMFEKDIHRNIKGVIKVAQTDEDNIHQELEEYVVTRELAKHLSKFYENYQKGIDGFTDKMGVWISGFFGSGKSHFLKILAYLLENKEVNGERAIDFFDNKVQDPMVLANMKRTANVETEVILFNIDSKSSVDGKSKDDAILKVFMKVFYEHRGFYGDIPGVAEMEKYLTKEGVYENFKMVFKDLSGEEWVERRNVFYFDADYVIGALTKVTNMSVESARNWFENGVNNFEISIEKFAKDVKDYIDSKGKNFHLVFLVDEIGQYIGDNQQLMLNLQTVAEDLGTYCNGKVWILVTSQESIDSILKVKGNDFSKIQGRFDTRLSLSSISVDEVIKKRILSKKEHVKETLQLMYHEDNTSATLKNLIDFKDSTADLRGYEDEKEFADVYPFIPYQFKLLQNVFEQVRKHGSSGKHLSEGERSMLSAFKEAGLKYSEEHEGALIPFYAFYDTIKEFLNPTIVRVIEGAYQNPELRDDEFNIDLLKVLFMIKYIKELPASLDNIATLMVTKVNEDKLVLKEKIESSLRKLIGQTLIQKNGDVYIFLTDDEQDINREIKSISIDEEVVKRALADYVFHDLYDVKKVKYSDKYDFSFNRKMDEKDYLNQTSNLGIHILSPLSDNYDKPEQEIMMMTMGSSQMILKLKGNESYVEEMEEVLKIDEYTKKVNPNLPENIQNIIDSKKHESKSRKRRVKELLEEAIKAGTFYINGEKLDAKGNTVKDKINTAFKTLVDNVYTKLGYVKELLNSEEDIKAILKNNTQQQSIEEFKIDTNELAENEVFSFIKLQDDISKQVRMKILLDRFTDKPYGWNEIDIAGITAELFKKERIRLRYNGQYLEPTDYDNVIDALRKPSQVDRVLIIRRVNVDESLLNTAKSLCKELFNKTDLPNDEDGLVRAIKSLISQQVEEIKQLKNRYEGRKYPGKSLLDKGLEYFNQFENNMDNVSFFTKLKDLEEDLIIWEEDVDYVRRFFENQKDIFDKGLLAQKNYEDNKLYLTDNDTEEAVNKLSVILEDILPYGKIRKIPELVNKIDEALNSVLKEKKENATTKIQADFDQLSLKASQYEVNANTKKTVESFYNNLIQTIESFTDIYKVDATISQSNSFKEKYEKIIENEIQQWLARQAEVNGEIVKDPNEEEKVEVGLEKINIKELFFVKRLNNEADVDKFIHSLSDKLKSIVKHNKNIEFID